MTEKEDNMSEGQTTHHTFLSSGVHKHSFPLHPSHVGQIVFCLYLPSEEHVAIVQQRKEVQCLSCCQTCQFRIVFVWVVLSGYLSVSYLCLDFQCTKSKPKDLKGMGHASSNFVSKDKAVQPTFWVKCRGWCGGWRGGRGFSGRKGGGVKMVVVGGGWGRNFPGSYQWEVEQVGEGALLL